MFLNMYKLGFGLANSENKTKLAQSVETDFSVRYKWGKEIQHPLAFNGARDTGFFHVIAQFWKRWIFKFSDYLKKAALAGAQTSALEFHLPSPFSFL